VERKKKDFAGKKFTVSFASFENCEVVYFPHPSSSRGLNFDYIKLFKPEMDKLIRDFKHYDKGHLFIE
jgi:hypothetical protein